MNKKRWMKTTAPSAVQPITEDLIYMKESTLARKDFTPVAPGSSNPNAWVQYCEDMPTIPPEDYIDYLTETLHTPGGATSYKRSPVCVTNLTQKKLRQSQSALSYNTDYDTGTQYTSGLDFDAVCFYFLANTSNIQKDGIADIAPVIDYMLQNAYNVSSEDDQDTPTVHVTHHNCAQYYGEQVKINKMPVYMIGETSSLANGSAPLNTITESTFMWSHFDLRATTPFYRSSSQIKSLTFLDATQLDIVRPLVKYPFFMTVSGTLGSAAVHYYWVAHIVLLPKGTNITERHIF